MKSKKIKVPIYDAVLYVHIISSERDRGNLQSKYNLTDTFAYDGFAFTHQNENGSYSYHIALSKKCSNLIAHECYHFVMFLSRDYGLKLDFENDEPQAFLMGWVVEQCYKVMK